MSDGLIGGALLLQATPRQQNSSAKKAPVKSALNTQSGELLHLCTVAPYHFDTFPQLGVQTFEVIPFGMMTHLHMLLAEHAERTCLHCHIHECTNST